MLTSLIQHGHDDIDAVRLAAGRCNDALQVCIMLIRRHRHILAVQFIGTLIRPDIADNKQVVSANRSFQHALCLACSKPRTGRLEKESVFVCSVETVQALLRTLPVGFFGNLPFEQIVIDPVAHGFAAIHGNDAKRGNRPRGEFLFGFRLLYHFSIVHWNPFLSGQEIKKELVGSTGFRQTALVINKKGYQLPLQIIHKTCWKSNRQRKDVFVNLNPLSYSFRPRFGTYLQSSRQITQKAVPFFCTFVEKLFHFLPFPPVCTRSLSCP